MMSASRSMTSNRPASLSGAGRRFARWLLGLGLLSVHIGIFLLAVVGLLLWNLARTPNDLWVDEPLRRWGLLVVFHATAVAAGWAAWRLMNTGTAPADAPTTVLPRLVSRSETGVEAVRSGAAPARSATSGSRVEQTARRWARDSVRVVRESMTTRIEPDGHAPAAHPASPLPSEAVGPDIAGWGLVVARHARGQKSTANGIHAPESPVMHEQVRETTSNGVAHGPIAWPPAVETRPRSDNEPPRTAASANGSWPAPPAIETSMPGFIPTPGPIDDRMAANGHSASATPNGMDEAARENARWTWVEAAAAAWLARREIDPDAAAPDPAPPASPPPTPDDAATSAP